MSIFRGFIASGISRTSSIESSPSFMSAPRDLDMVGKREAALERAVGDPAIDEVAALLVALVRLAAGHQQHVLLRRDVDFLRREAGDRELDR